MSALDAWVSVPGPVLLLVAAGLLGLLGFVDRRGLWLLLGVTTLTVVAGAVAFPPLPLGILSCLLLGLGMAAARIPRLPSRQVRKNCHLALVVLAFVLAMPIAVAGFTPFMVRNRPAHLAQCQANLHQVADALQKYSLDHQGRYPPTLQALVPRYLELPRCMGPAPAPPRGRGLPRAVRPGVRGLRIPGHHGTRPLHRVVPGQEPSAPCLRVLGATRGGLRPSHGHEPGGGDARRMTPLPARGTATTPARSGWRDALPARGTATTTARSGRRDALPARGTATTTARSGWRDALPAPSLARRAPLYWPIS